MMIHARRAKEWKNEDEKENGQSKKRECNERRLIAYEGTIWKNYNNNLKPSVPWLGCEY